MSSECAAGFCRARFALRDAQRVSREELSELQGACRSTRKELLDNMLEHGVECVSLQDAASGTTRFARVVDKAARHVPLKCADDVLKFSHDLSSHIREVTDAEVPKCVSTLILSRARVETTGKRLSITKSVPSNVNVTPRPPAPVTTATTSFVSSSQEHANEQQRVQGLRARVRDSEKQLASVLPPNDPILLKVLKPDGSERLVRIENTVETRGGPPKVGLRRLSDIVMEAARHALQDRQQFDERFQTMVRTLFDAHTAMSKETAPKRRIRVVERRVTRAGSTSAQKTPSKGHGPHPATSTTSSDSAPPPHVDQKLS